MDRKRWLANVLLFLTAMIWGAAIALQRAGMDRIGPAAFNGSRMALAALAVTPAALLLRARGKRARGASAQRERDRDTLLGGALCGLCLGTATLLQQVGLVSTAAGKAAFLTAVYMLLVPLLLALSGRRQPRTVWIAVAAGLAGMYLLCVTEGLRLMRGDALCCASALFFALHILCCGRYARTGEPVGVAAVQFAVSSLISWSVSLLTERTGAEAFRAALWPLLYCGVLSGGVGFTLQIVAQKHTDPTVASLLMSLEAVFAAIAGVLLLRERMSPREIAGCALLFAAVVLVQLPERPKGGEGPDETDGARGARL